MSFSKYEEKKTWFENNNILVDESCFPIRWLSLIIHYQGSTEQIRVETLHCHADILLLECVASIKWTKGEIRFLPWVDGAPLIMVLTTGDSWLLKSVSCTSSLHGENTARVIQWDSLDTRQTQHPRAVNPYSPCHVVFLLYGTGVSNTHVALHRGL